MILFLGLSIGGSKFETQGEYLEGAADIASEILEQEVDNRARPLLFGHAEGADKDVHTHTNPNNFTNIFYN